MLLTSIDGVQREIKELWEGKDGVNTETKEMWAGVDGVNKQIFSSGPSAILDNNSWEAIRQAADEGIAEALWSVGDRKGITLNGKLSDGLTLSNYTCYPYILGFNHNKKIEGDKTITFQIGYDSLNGGTNIAIIDSGYKKINPSGSWFSINNSNTNNGGWERSRIRTIICPAFKNSLPADLRNVLKPATKYTDNTGGYTETASHVTATTDEIFLLAEFEVIGRRSHANSAEQNYQLQYDYYKNGNSQIKYRHNSTELTAEWWLRSAEAEFSNSFCLIYSSVGTAASGAAGGRGFAPAFVV